ncbi:MAG: Ig-like domain-containing protein, partial [Candidatus Thermoplasmatota archaeon]|nr:Ig-like domain-containing protein [Candidatus Thermoplasmatota archaeon]
STPAGTDHAVTLTGLEVGTSYWAYISANETEDVVVWFNTSSVVDETPPDLLNLAAEVLEDGRVTVSWYTSESATESVLINGESVHEDPFATKKNHAFTTEVLGDGTYNLEVVSADASGNLNSSTLSFTVDAGATVDDTPGTVDDGGTDESSSSEVSDTTLQVVALIVLALVLLAFLRVRGHEPDEDDPWN